jgi:hypothetical protein
MGPQLHSAVGVDALFAVLKTRLVLTLPVAEPCAEEVETVITVAFTTTKGIVPKLELALGRVPVPVQLLPITTLELAVPLPPSNTETAVPTFDEVKELLIPLYTISGESGIEDLYPPCHRQD